MVAPARVPDRGKTMSDDPGQSAINPFVVPGYENAYSRPLCPWTHQEHTDYFVDVDHTEANFAAFQRNMSNIAALQTYGRLVLVTGPPGSGKSALIHRCAHWAQKAFGSAGLRAELLDLSDAILLDRNQQKSTVERMRLVSRRLCQDLEPKLLSREDHDALLDKVDEPEMIYPMLAGRLAAGVTLIVLLPRMDLDTLSVEAEYYARLAKRRILFFAECLEPTRQQSHAVRAISVQQQPLVITVGSLKPGDATGFVIDRLNRHKGTGVYPEPAENWAELLDGDEALEWTMKALQTVFSGIYARRYVDDPVNYGVNGDRIPRREIRDSFITYLTLGD
jgi:hypothetical protein